MGRHPIGDQAMTVAERQRRYLAKLVASARPPPAPASELVVRLDHLRRWPDQTAPWLCQRLGHSAALALRDALNRALEAALEIEEE